MKISDKQIELQQKLINLFGEYQAEFFTKDRACIAEKRLRSIDLFEQKGFPSIREEAWRSTNLTNALSKNYTHLSGFDTQNIEYEVESYDLDNKTANIKVKAIGQSVIKSEGGALNKSQLSGMSKQQVIDHFLELPEVNNVEVELQPGWIIRMPKNPDRIDVIIR